MARAAVDDWSRSRLKKKPAEMLDYFPCQKPVGVKRGGQTSLAGGEMTKKPLILLVELTRIERATS